MSENVHRMTKEICTNLDFSQVKALIPVIKIFLHSTAHGYQSLTLPYQYSSASIYCKLTYSNRNKSQQGENQKAVTADYEEQQLAI